MQLWFFLTVIQGYSSWIPCVLSGEMILKSSNPRCKIHEKDNTLS